MLPVLFSLLLFQADPVDKGIQLLEQEKYADAVAVFQKVVSADPKNLAGHFHLGLAHSLLNQDADAIAAYRKVLELDPKVYEAQLNLGILLLRGHQAAEAAKLLEAAHQNKPNQPKALLYLAEAQRASENLPRAAELYQQILQNEPKNAAAHAGLAQTLVRQNKPTEALASFRQAAALDPAYDSQIAEYAATLEKAGRKKDALDVYATMPDSPAVLERRAMLQLDLGDPAAAITTLEAVVKQSPTAANRYALATAYLRAKQPEKAAPVLEAAVQNEPNAVELRLMLGRLLRDQRNFPGAAQQFAMAARLQPNSVEALKELTAMLIQTKNYDPAIQALDRLKQLGEDPPAHDYFRALIYDQQHIYKPALAAYQSFLARSEGKFPEEEFKARQRVKVIIKELNKR